MKWFAMKKINDDIFIVKEIFYKEHANIYIIKGTNKSLIIDTGTGIYNLASFLKLKNTVVINTHAHYDHCGGNWAFHNILIHKKEKDILRKPEKNKTLSFLLKNEDFIKKPYKNFDVNKYRIKKSERTEAISNKRIINTGNNKLEIIHTPGHSPGSICIVDRKNKILFSGDTLYNGKDYYIKNYSNKKDFIKSLKKISKMDINLVMPGHNEIMNKKLYMVVAKNMIREMRT